MNILVLSNLENVNNFGSWQDWVKPLLGTVVGFSLGLIPALIARIRHKNRTGKFFKYELESLQIGLKEQIEEIKRYREVFINPPTDGKGLQYLTLVLLHKFEIVKSLDKVTLIKYYKREHKKFATYYVGGLFQMFGVIERDTERMDKIYTEYQLEFDKISDSYFDEINSLRVLAIMERDRLGLTEWDKDLVLKKLWDVAFSKQPSWTTHAIMEFAKDLHPKLLNDGNFSDVKHSLYKPILDFALKGSKIVSEYEGRKKKYLGLLNSTEQTYESAYKELTGEN